MALLIDILSKNLIPEGVGKVTLGMCIAGFILLGIGIYLVLNQLSGNPDYKLFKQVVLRKING